MMAGDGQPGLPPFRLEVARMFFALPASRGFLLAGGGATGFPRLRDPGRADARP